MIQTFCVYTYHVIRMCICKQQLMGLHDFTFRELSMSFCRPEFHNIYIVCHDWGINMFNICDADQTAHIQKYINEFTTTCKPHDQLWKDSFIKSRQKRRQLQRCAFSKNSPGYSWMHSNDSRWSYIAVCAIECFDINHLAHSWEDNTVAERQSNRSSDRSTSLR